MLNQRMEYWRQERLKEACEFCPNRKPNTQTTYEGRSLGRTPFMNIGATYNGDYGNEIVLSNVQFNGFDPESNKEETDKYECYYYKADGGDEGENKGGVGDEDEDEDDKTSKDIMKSINLGNSVTVV